jgi:hypothetical protein
MHKVGDVVRLNRGWSPMVVLHVTDSGEVWAIYARKHERFPLTRWHYTNWKGLASYHRPQCEFTVWDGEPINKEWNFFMPRRYITIKGPVFSGVFMNTTSNGDMVLELPSGDVKAFPASYLEEIVPNTFRVQSMANSYSCHYIAPDNVLILTGDILLSNSANVYVVKETNTKNTNPKGVFKGRRLVTEEL